MKRIISILISLVLLLSMVASYAETIQTEETGWTTTITGHFATVEEARAQMRGRTLYHAQINEGNLAFLLQKKGGTLDEYIDYATEQVLPFTEEDEKAISETLEWLRQQLESHGLKLPDPGAITFIKTTGQEALGSAGYTSGGCVFLTEKAFEYIGKPFFHEIVTHEIFHKSSIAHC